MLFEFVTNRESFEKVTKNIFYQTSAKEDANRSRVIERLK
jgi:hypothetical protein